MAGRTRPTPSARAGLLYGLGLAALWLVLALLTLTTTFHLGPLLVAGAPPILTATSNHGSAPTISRLAVFGVALALATTLVLSITDTLTGPSLLPVGVVVLDSVVFALIGGFAGLVVALAIARS